MVLVPTAVVLTVNDADVAPAATVTVAGTVALAVSELRLMTRPALGAWPLRDTVAVAELPPSTEFGVTLIPVSEAGLIVRFAVC